VNLWLKLIDERFLLYLQQKTYIVLYIDLYWVIKVKEEKRRMPLKWKISALISWVLALTTVIPAPASKPCLLGYYAHCSFTPASTVILIVLGLGFLALGIRKKRERKSKGI